MNDVERIYRAILRYGLKLRSTDVPHSEAMRQKAIIRELLTENSTDTLLDAIKYGMHQVWPFSEDGRSFAAGDLEKNLLKAMGEAGKARRAGEIAYRPRRDIEHPF